MCTDCHHSAMGLVAEYEIDCASLPLVDVAAAVPRATLRVEIQFNHGNRPLFNVYVTGGDAAAVEEAVESSAFVADYTPVGRAGETRQYKTVPATSLAETLGDEIDDLDELRALARAEALIERIEATPTGWIQAGWFADRTAFDQFREFWGENATFTLRRLTRDGEPAAPGDGLTDRQQEALRTAYEMGYFEIPRTASLEGVAAELDITASSLSERLRRAQSHVIETSVASTWPPLPE